MSPTNGVGNIDGDGKILMMMNFIPYFISLERVGTVQNTKPEELERYGFFKKSKARVTKHDDQSKSIIMKERIWINRVINETTFETCEANGNFPPVRETEMLTIAACTHVEPHGTCVDGVNSHSCCCDPGFQETEVDRVKLDFTHTTNAQNVSYRLKVNEFAPLTTRSDETEPVSQYTGYKPSNVWSGLKHSRRALCTEKLPERVMSVGRLLRELLSARTH